MRKFRIILTAQKEILGAQMERNSGSVGAEDHHCANFADIPANTCEEERSGAVMGFVKKKQDDVDEALARIERGEYGFCSDCGGTILLTRQASIPTARRCFSCQEKHREAQSRRASVPIYQGLYLRD